MSDDEPVLDSPKLHSYITKSLIIMRKSMAQIELMLAALQDGESRQKNRVIDPRVAEGRLSPTEKRIMEEFRRGNVRRSLVAAELSISPRTFDQLIIRMREKLGLATKHDLVAYAAETRP